MIFFRILAAVPQGFRRRFAGVLVLSLGAAVAQGISIGFLLPVLQFVEDDTLPQGGVWRGLHGLYDTLGVTMNLPSLLVGVLVMIIVAQVLIYFERSQAIKIREKFTVYLRQETFKSYVGADIAYLQSAGRGNMVNALTTETVKAAEAIHSLIEFTARCLLIAVYVGVLLLISWQTYLGGMAIVVVASLLVQYQIRKATKLGNTLVELRNQFQTIVVERLEGARLVKLTAKEDQEQAHFQKVSSGLSTFAHRLATNRAQIRLIMEPTIVGGGLLVLYLSVEFLNISLAQLAIFMYILVRLAPEALNLNTLWQGIAAGEASLKSVQYSLRESGDSTTIYNGSKPFMGLNSGITFENVSCSYDHSQPVLQHIDMTIPQGKLTVIMGPSGVGKSTLLDLLVRLGDPTEGRILLDNTDLKEFDLNSLRPYIGMASQDVMLFSETIMANLKYGHPDVIDEQVVEAAHKANALQFIRALPEGFNTILGHRGLTLSGGERQRLALARALVGDPELLLLDEVTNNLDSESRQLIHTTIREAAKDRTVVVSTHDLALIELADKVVVLEEGKVVEEGTPQQLSGGGGLFQRYLSYVQSNSL